MAQSALFNGGNNQVMFDNISITTVPAPGSLVLVTEGALCLQVGLTRSRTSR
jgi:hypothetical protein